MRSLNPFSAVFVLSAVFALVAGCGHDGGGGRSTPTPTSTRTTTATTTPTVTATTTPTATPTITVALLQPRPEQLSAAGAVDVEIRAASSVEAGRLTLVLDGEQLAAELTRQDAQTLHTLLNNVAPGRHALGVRLDGIEQGAVNFETVALNNPAECEILNNEECLLPYPSSRFLESGVDTASGRRLNFPRAGMPEQFGEPVSTAPYRAADGFSPTVQILMHFPGNVDIGRSNAARLHTGSRTTDLRSLDADSPSVLIDADSGEHLLHFLENDLRAADQPTRQVLFLRPGRSLSPGHHYIVAMRDLAHADGSPVTAEAPFAALRDNRPTSIAAIEDRRADFEEIFSRLQAAGVARDNLVLAFDFYTASDAWLTNQMVSMRDQAFAWLDGEVAAGRQTFNVETVTENDCSVPGTVAWRLVEGTYQAPLFLTIDPVQDRIAPGILNVDGNDIPVQNGFTTPPFTIAIPCTSLDPENPTPAPLVLGHGLFGTGRGFVKDLASGIAGTSEQFNFISGATDWWGLSEPDITPPLQSFILVGILSNLDNIAALPDRLRQGQLNAVLLGHMMKLAAFNLDPAFRTPAGAGVFPGPDEEMYYLGGSLGGVMGLMFSAISPDITNADIIVGSINFSFLLQRATPFVALEGTLKLTGITDPMTTALGLSLLHELWVRGESAGYATHITSNPLPNTNAKNVLMNMAWLDQQVSNQGTEITARTLGIPNLRPGSLRSGFPLIPDVDGPVPSALVVYDTGSFDRNNPDHAPFIPPLGNAQAQPNGCDPHSLSSTSPAAIRQITQFFRPGGMIENFCNGDCDAAEPLELPGGRETVCDPLAP